MSDLERIDLLYSTFIVGIIDILQVVSPFLAYKYFGANWVESLDHELRSWK